MLKSSAFFNTVCVATFKVFRHMNTNTMSVKLAANLTMLYPEIKTLSEKYDCAKKSGFKFVEFGFPFGEQKDDLKAAKEAAGLEQVLMNAFPGNIQNGDIGLAALPDRKKEFRESIVLTIEYAKALNCKRVHVMAGKTSGQDQKLCDDTYLQNIAFAAEEMEKEGIMCLIEPINNTMTIPGYYLTDIQKAVNIIKKINKSNVKLQFDFYHIQLLHGNLTENLKKYLPYIGHIQIAQAPDRVEPGFPGEINYSYVFKLLEDVGYDGYIGLEYKPKGDTDAGLKWLKEMNLKL